jgi:DNA-binding MarR family transcriptional regulator
MSLAQHRLFKSTDAAFKEEVGVSHTQLGVLWFLEQSPAAMLKDVSDALGINPSAITALIGRMEDAGWFAANFPTMMGGWLSRRS